MLLIQAPWTPVLLRVSKVKALVLLLVFFFIYTKQENVYALPNGLQRAGGNKQKHSKLQQRFSVLFISKQPTVTQIQPLGCRRHEGLFTKWDRI